MRDPLSKQGGPLNEFHTVILKELCIGAISDGMCVLCLMLYQTAILFDLIVLYRLLQYDRVLVGFIHICSSNECLALLGTLWMGLN